MKKTKITKWDAIDYLKTEEDIQLFLETMFEDGTPEEITEAIGIVARARKMMSKIAKKSKVSRTSLYNSLSKEGSPSFKTLNFVANYLGYQFYLRPLDQHVKHA